MAFTLRRGTALVVALLAAGALASAALRAVGPALVLGLAAVLVGLLGLGTGARRAAWASTPVEVPPEESEQIDGEVTACLRCGSTQVGAGSALQGHIPGAGDAFAWVCRRCGHRGTPLTFEDRTRYRAFVQGLHEGGSGGRSP